MVVEFFFDVGSPYAYLAATRLDDFQRRTGAVVRWCPFLLGGVFKATGNSAPSTVPAKARWMLTDLSAWATRYQVPFHFPGAIFPVNSLLPQRSLTACDVDERPAFALELFDAYWARGLDVSKADIVRAAAAAVGLDGDRLITAASAQPVKDTLRATTEDAVARGAFGAPTFFVGERMFWGNDRLALVEDALKSAG